MTSGVSLLSKLKNLRKEWRNISLENQDKLVKTYSTNFHYDISLDRNYIHSMFMEKLELLIITLREENHLEKIRIVEFSERYKRRKDPSFFVDTLVFPTLEQAGHLSRFYLEYLGRKLLNDVGVVSEEIPEAKEVLTPPQKLNSDGKKKKKPAKKKQPKKKIPNSDNSKKAGESETDEGTSEVNLSSPYPSESERQKIDDDLELFKSHFKTDAFEGNWIVVGEQKSNKKDHHKKKAHNLLSSTEISNQTNSSPVKHEKPVKVFANNTKQQISQASHQQPVSSAKSEQGNPSKKTDSNRKRIQSGSSNGAGDKIPSTSSLQPEPPILSSETSVGGDSKSSTAPKLSFRERVAKATRNREGLAHEQWFPQKLDPAIYNEEISAIWHSVKILPELDEKTRPDDGKFYKYLSSQLQQVLERIHSKAESLRGHFQCTLERLKKIIKTSFNEEELTATVYGSVATGLIVPGSDMDICLTGLKGLDRTQVISLLQTLRDNLGLFSWAVDIKFIPTASIPVLKLVILV
jgi:predicted nucleotidyltransferase